MKKQIRFSTFAIALILLGSNNVVADEVINPSLASQYVITPTSTDLGRYGDIPVSYYTGQADISIPLFSTTQMGIPFQIALSYDGSGHLLNKLPGWTGHNWNLMSGGVITRVENEQADEWIYDSKSNGAPSQPLKYGFFYNYSATNRYIEYLKKKEVDTNNTLYYNFSESSSNLNYWDFWVGDTQPDVFYFNFCGMSGRFFLGNDGEWKVYSENNIKVIFDIEDANNYILPFIERYPYSGYLQPKTIKGFTLIDENGTKYVFGGDQSSIEYSIPLSGVAFDNKYTSWHASAWHLTQIIDRFGNQLYSFQYKRGYFVTHATSGKSETYTYGQYQINDKTLFKLVPYWKTKVNSGISFYIDNNPQYHFSISAPTYLSSISMQDGTEVLFSSSKAFSTNSEAYKSLYDKYYKKYSTDAGRNYGSSFFVTDFQKIVGTTDANKRYFYLVENGTYGTKCASYRYCSKYDSIKYDPFRATGLKCLDQIKILQNGRLTQVWNLKYNEKSPRMHLTEIEMSNAQGGDLQTYRLTYKDYDKIPKDYLSTESDNWGYYGRYYDIIEEYGESKTPKYDTVWFWNAGNYVFKCVPREDYVAPSKYHAESRECDTERAQYGALQDIQYPTGGHAVFEFEQNDYTYCKQIVYNRITYPSVPATITGGLRIRSITLYSDSEKKQKAGSRLFLYTKGGVTSGQLAMKPIGTIVWNPKNDNAKMESVYTSDKSIIPLQTSFGPHVGYSQVTEILDDQTRTVYTFSNIMDTKHDMEYDFRFQTSVTPYDHYSELGFCRGRLLSKTIFDNKGKKLYEQSNSYRDLNEVLKDWVYSANIIRMQAGTNSYDPNFQYFVGGIYKLYYPKYDIASTTERHYEEDGKTYVESQTHYSRQDYDGMRFDSSVEKKWNTSERNSKSVSEKVQYFYAFDLFAKRKKILLKEERNLRMIYDDISDEEFAKILKNKREPNSNYLYYDTVSFKKQHFYPIVSTRKYYNNVIVDSVYMRYELFDNKLLTAYELSRGDTLTQYLSYNENGLPTQIQQLGKPKSYLFWDNARIYAIITTPDKRNIVFDKNATIDNTLKIGGISIYQQPNTEATIVKYNQLNQIASITNPSGITQYYEYDAMGRLCAEKDQKGIVISTTSYHIQDKGHNFIENQVYPEYGYGTMVQYYDGLGRPTLQTTNASSVNGKYVYAMQEYDQMGRVSKTWNSIPDGNQSEDKNIAAFKALSHAFYNDSYGYSLLEYDAFGRVIKATRPGKLWRENKKSADTKYGYNHSDDKIKHYSYSASGGTLNFDYYSTGDLASVTSISEDGRISVIYKDNLGNVVLERSVYGSETNDTYYVYDNKSRLTWVLQPMYQKDPDNKKFAFHYQYNDKNLVINKTIPGCQPITFEYDKYNRVIKMQDGVLSQAGKYRGYTYDPLGRIEAQGICLSNGTKVYDEIVNYYDKDVVLKRNEKKLFVSNSCKYGLGQLTASWQRASNGDPILTTFSYDEYGRLQKREEMLLDNHLSETHITYNTVGDIISEKTIEYDYSNGVYVPKLESNVQNAYYGHTNLLKTSLLSMTEYKKGVRQGTKNITMQDLSYNDLGRVIANNRSGNAGDIRYAYDDLHGWLTGINSGAGFEQHLYREIEGNVKRWDGSISAMTWKVGANDVEHRYDYTFDGLNRMIDAAYSEKSSVASAAAYRYAFWEDDNIGILPDPQNRTQGNYGEHIVYDMNSNIIQMQRSGMLNDKSYGLIDNLGISYEGNQRVKITDAVRDNLDYANAFDFRDGVDSEKEYAYNANGALNKDLNKNITNIEYDLLGNPKKVTIYINNRTHSDNRFIEYIYSADGRRLKTIHSRYIGTPSGGGCVATDTTSYFGNLILKNEKPQMYRFSGGYYDFKDDGSLSDAHYYIADYQGNNRMVVNASTDAVEQINHYYAYGGIIGNLSSNEGLQEFKFGDKKLDRTYGLDLYDVEARQYDAITPWFTSIDPLAEKYYSISPYVYCAGDPVNLIDPTGEWYVKVSAYKNRAICPYAVYNVYNKNNELVFRTIVKVLGNGRDRSKTNNDTPCGRYKLLRWQQTGGKTKYKESSFGKHYLLFQSYLDPNNTGRNGMHTHAGDLRKDGHLRGTHGCLRISQEDIDALKMISDELEEQGDFMDYLEVDDDLENPIDDIQSRGDIFYKQTHFNEFNYSHEETTIQQPDALRYMNAFIQELEEKESKNK